MSIFYHLKPAIVDKSEYKMSGFKSADVEVFSLFGVIYKLSTYKFLLRI